MTPPNGPRPKESTLILGLGNPLRGDDGVGPAVLARLQREVLPNWTRLVDGGTGGLEILLEFEGATKVIAVDAAFFGGSPGEVRRFDLLDTQLGRTHWGAGHAHGLGAAIELASALQQLPRELILYAIEPENLDSLGGLSTVVARAIPSVVARILAELEPMVDHASVK